MVRFSEIFKKKGDLIKQGGPGEAAKSPYIKFPGGKEASEGGLAEGGQPTGAAPEIMRKPLNLMDKKTTNELYQQALRILNNILIKAKNNQPFPCGEVGELVEKFAEQLSAGNSELLDLTLRYSSENYLLTHSVNTCILSLLVGLSLNYAQPELIDLGVSAFLYDIGMSKFEDISSLPRELSQAEYERIKQHPELGAQLLRSCQPGGGKAGEAASQHHESMDGKGYPRGLTGERIDEFARVIAVVDTYEALTHPRAQRDRMVPYDAFKELFRDKERFDPKIIKILVEQIGIYPVGSWVQLSTSEIGQVVSISKYSPLRPTIDVKVDPQGKRQTEERVLDLSQFPAVYIKRAVDEKDITV